MLKFAIFFAVAALAVALPQPMPSRNQDMKSENTYGLGYASAYGYDIHHPYHSGIGFRSGWNKPYWNDPIYHDHYGYDHGYDYHPIDYSPYYGLWKK